MPLSELLKKSSGLYLKDCSVCTLSKTTYETNFILKRSANPVNSSLTSVKTVQVSPISPVTPVNTRANPIIKTVPISPISLRPSLSVSPSVSSSPARTRVSPARTRVSPVSPRTRVSPVSPRTKVIPVSPRTRVSPRVKTVPVSPRTRVSPLSPRIKTVPVSPRVKTIPVSPRTRVTPVSPRTRVSPVSQRTRVSPVSQRTRVSPRVKTVPVSPRVKTVPVSPRTKVSPVSPRTKVSPVSPRTKISPVSPRTRVSPVSPRTRVSPVSPRTRVSPVSPRTRVSPVSPRVKTVPVNARTRVSPVSSRVKTVPVNARTRVSPVSPRVKTVPVNTRTRTVPESSRYIYRGGLVNGSSVGKTPMFRLKNADNSNVTNADLLSSNILLPASMRVETNTPRKEDIEDIDISGKRQVFEIDILDDPLIFLDDNPFKDKYIINNEANMDINMDLFDNYHRIMDDFVNDKAKYRNFKQRNQILAGEILEEEIQLLLTEGSVCQVDELRDLRSRVNQINDNGNLMIRDRFYDPEIMKNMMCLSDSIMYLPGDEDGIISYNQRIRYWIHNLSRIGAESVYGYAMKANFTVLDDSFVVKAPRLEGDQSLVHEWFVGTRALNNLRSEINNFAYVYGGFQCSQPVINNDGKVDTWCNNTETNVNYVVYESIFPSISIGEYCETCDFVGFLDKYIQVLYALDIAHAKYDFTHYDLHSENVVIRDLKPGANQYVWLPYTLENGQTEYIRTNGISTIIDYGSSHVKMNNLSYGTRTLLQDSSFTLTSFPMHDAYKLLMFCLETMLKSGNEDCFVLSSRLLYFFNKYDSRRMMVQDQRKNYYSLPYLPETASVKHRDFINYIKANVPQSKLVIYSREELPSNVKIIGCQNIGGTEKCISSLSAKREFGIKYNLEANEPFEFYDIVTSLEKNKQNNKENGGSIKGVVEYYSQIYEMEKGKWLGNLRTGVDFLMKYLGEINIIKVNVRDPRLKDNTYLKENVSQLRMLLSAFDRYQNMDLTAKSLEFSADYLNDKDMSKDVKAERVELVNAKNEISRMKEIVKINYRDFQNMPKASKTIWSHEYKIVLDIINI